MTRYTLTPLLLLLLASGTRAQATEPTSATTSTGAAADSDETAPPATPAAPSVPATPAPAAEGDIDWLRAGVGIGSFVLQQNGFAFTPGLSAVVEACPSEVFCVFGSGRGTASTYPNASGAFLGLGGAPFSSSSLVSLGLDVGGRYVLAPGALVEVSPWLSLGVGGGFAEGTTFSVYDPITGGLLPTQNSLFGGHASLTAGVLAEREMWQGVRVRVSTSLLSGSAAWTNASSGGTSVSDLSFALDLVLQPSFAVLLEL